jgi:hypothetical protein
LLLLIAKHREVGDLMVANPMLLSLCLNKLESTGEAAWIRSLREPQRKLLSIYCEFAESQRLVNIVRKIPVEEMRFVSNGVPRALDLERLENPKVLRYFAHRPVVTAYEVCLLMSRHLFKLFETRCDVSMVSRLAISHLNSLPATPELRLPRFLSAILKRFRDQARMRWSAAQRFADWPSELPFACPPNWVHLDTLGAVVAEGKALLNCLDEPDWYLVEDSFLFRIEPR